MPLVRSSQEVYNYLKRKSGETGEPMSILLDRWMVREVENAKQRSKAKDTSRVQSRATPRAKKRERKAGNPDKQARSWLWGIEGLLPET